MFENDLTEKQNLSNPEKKALKTLIKNWNEVICVNDTDKNLGAISADKEEVFWNVTGNFMTSSHTINVKGRSKKPC